MTTVQTTSAGAATREATVELLERQSSILHNPAVDASSTSSTARPTMQARPPELPSATAEIIFILICSCSQFLFTVFMGDVTILQDVLLSAINTQTAELPWLQGAFMLANGLAVIISGSLADLIRPRYLVNSALGWLVVWNCIGGASIVSGNRILFYLVRAMQGCAIGVLISTTFSMLGRTYTPGRRKNRVFSVMSAAAPIGFSVGALQGAALANRPDWVFWTNAMLSGLVLLASIVYLPDLAPSARTAGRNLSIKSFDYVGASLGLVGSACLLFGLTQGTPAEWAPYTIVTVILGLLLLACFAWAETRVARPLIPMVLWRTPGFTPLVIAYGFGFGSYIAWQFYAVRFFLSIQDASPLSTALYVLPNAIVGVAATFAVSYTFHIFPAHFIFILAMLSFALGPVFFLPQTAGTSYWALSMPGIALVTLGPDLSFAAASIFITNQVPRSYQGAAGSLLVTIQNVSSAILTSLSDAIGVKVSGGGHTQVDLQGLRAVWWFNFATSLVAIVVCAVFVRIPKSEERAHVED